MENKIIEEHEPEEAEEVEGLEQLEDGVGEEEPIEFLHSEKGNLPTLLLYRKDGLNFVQIQASGHNIREAALLFDHAILRLTHEPSLKKDNVEEGKNPLTG